MSKENKKIKLIIPSKEDIKRNEQLQKDFHLLTDMIIQFSMIPKKYFNSKDDDE